MHLLDEQLCCGKAYAAASACNDRDFPFKFLLDFTQLAISTVPDILKNYLLAWHSSYYICDLISSIILRSIVGIFQKTDMIEG
jgi:hypothetical protein